MDKICVPGHWENPVGYVGLGFLDMLVRVVDFVAKVQTRFWQQSLSPQYNIMKDQTFALLALSSKPF